MTDRIFEELFERYPRLEACRGDIYKAFELMSDCYDNGGKLLCCGNGGSAADCDHLVGELMKGFLKKRPFSPEKRSFSATRRWRKICKRVCLQFHSAPIRLL